ncbi:MAG TPA: YrdB family protein [Bacteroidia bacterium]|nr:YrdB family protein [Bacteroidia bacterium]
MLELSALLIIGAWGWRQAEGAVRFFPALGLPLLVAAIWGIFNVPNDPSRSGAAPVITPGLIRLGIELSIFTLATLALYVIRAEKYYLIFGGIVLLHYLVSYDRIIWLLKH